jgi:hypothetical protein
MGARPEIRRRIGVRLQEKSLTDGFCGIFLFTRYVVALNLLARRFSAVRV